MYFIFLIMIVVAVIAFKAGSMQGHRRPQRCTGNRPLLMAFAAITAAAVMSSALTIVIPGISHVHSTALAESSTEEQRIEQPAQSVEGVPAESESTEISNNAAAPSDAVATGKDLPAKDQAEFNEARKLEIEQVMTRIGQFVRANLDLVSSHPTGAVLGQAAESSNGDVVVFQPSDELIKQILGAGGQELLKSFNSELPDHIRQAYALIPLTPPVGSAVPVKPLLATGGLKTIANSLVSFVEGDDAVSPDLAVEKPELPAEAESVQDVKPETRPMPDWINGTDGRRIVVHTKPILPGDDSEALLAIAINDALATHIDSVTAAMSSDLHQQSQFVRMELPQSTAKKYVVDTFERHDVMETQTEGATPFRVIYALLEFPDEVDQMAVRQIRQSIQQDRVKSLGVTIGFVWMSVCSAGFGIRQWRRGTRLRRAAAIPVFAGIAIPTLLIAVAIVFALANGKVVSNWRNSEPVRVELGSI